MTDIEVLEREKQCVQRKTAINCSDCAHCDLLMDDAVILAAYDKAISALRAKRVQKVNDLYDEDGKEIYEENRESSTMFTLDEAIQHCYETVERLRKATLVIPALPSMNSSLTGWRSLKSSEWNATGCARTGISVRRK